jgi:Sensors of blue-light using FAD
MAGLRTIEYVSSTTQAYNDVDLRKLLDRALHFNVDAGVTGLLLFEDGVFVQTFEGLDQDVQRVFDRIRNDSSHRIMRVFADDSIERRVFPDWAMMANFIAPNAPIVAHLETCRTSQDTAIRNSQVAALNRAIEFLKHGAAAQGLRS